MKIKTYSRPRPFVAVTDKGRFELLTCSSNQPAKKYITRMVGPFKTTRGARFYRNNAVAMFLLSINQIELLAQEVTR